ncbi:MAG: DinB family protein, partial [Candidatus Thorarchaeota archaeon]|nr:DinB family protein [Candidatus Thorarchaeota archaeon]
YFIMTDTARTTLKQGLVAYHIHSEPQNVMKGLTTDNVTKRLTDGTHTIWELLNHLIFWQDISIEAIEEKEVDWSRAKTGNWPEPVESITQSELDKHVTKYLNGIEKLSTLADEVDLASGMPSWPKATKHWAIQMIAQHNSYHLGQIVTLRQMNSDWSPAEG